jgi:hypothetical protein
VTKYDYSEGVATTERIEVRMFVHPAFLWTDLQFGLHIVDHVGLTASNQAPSRNEEAGISPGFVVMQSSYFILAQTSLLGPSCFLNCPQFKRGGSFVSVKKRERRTIGC